MRSGGSPMRYDVVCSIYKESEKGDFLVESLLIAGGFNSDDAALEYINTHDCSNQFCSEEPGYDNQIEIECHTNEDSIFVVAVD